jgi:hypothetical protein
MGLMNFRETKRRRHGALFNFKILEFSKLRQPPMEFP